MDSQADLRWGADGKGLRRILAPNGICVLGTWEITSDNPYTGYYQKGAKGLTIGRFSSDGNETKRGQRRSISLGMKIYPTMDPNHPTPLIPASVIAQEDLGGMRTGVHQRRRAREHAERAQPIGAGFTCSIMLRAGPHFFRARQGGRRPPASRARRARQARERADQRPDHMMFKMAQGQRRVEGQRSRFPRRDLRATCSIRETQRRPAPWTSTSSCRTRAAGRAFQGLSRVTVNDWQRIGTLRFTEAIGLVQRRPRHPVPPPWLARQPERPVHGDSRRTSERVRR